VPAPRSQTDLRSAIAQAGYTPAARDLDGLIDLMVTAEADEAPRIQRAVARVAGPALQALLGRLREQGPPGRARLARLLGYLARATEAARPAVMDLLRDADPATRREAAMAAGRLLDDPDRHFESALLSALDEAGEDQRLRAAIVEALGKVGGDRARRRLAALAPEALPPRAARAAVRLARVARVADSHGASHAASNESPHAAPKAARHATPKATVDGGIRASRPLPLIVHSRTGLEALAAEECDPRWKAAISGQGRVSLQTAGPLRDLFRVRTALSFAFPLPPGDLNAAGGVAEALAAALTSSEASAVLDAFSPGGARYRIDFSHGKHRATIFRCAELLAAARPQLINDPSNRSWEVHVDVDAERSRLSVELEPLLDDPRFSYRLGDVSASSHPTIAAALARVGGVHANDVVWDPFTGSGSELIERGLLGPSAKLIGWDISPSAVATAARNARAAGIRVELAQRDSLAQPPPQGVTLLVTNPPLGRRQLPGTDLDELVDRVLRQAALCLAPGGRVAWISPRPTRSARTAEALGFRVELRREVDLGGFTAELQKLVWLASRGGRQLTARRRPATARE
jgi:23S rRNA G2445 N2-methylase RlmL